MEQLIKKIIIPRFDTMGDIVLFSGVIDALYAEYPGVEITVMVMDKMKHVSSILDPAIRWWPVPAALHDGKIAPLYTGELDYDILEDIIIELRKKSYDLLIGPLYSQTFLGSFIARASGIARRVGYSSDDCFDVEKVPEKHRDLLPVPTYTETTAVEEWSPEIVKNQHLLNAIRSQQGEVLRPKVQIREKARIWAERFIKENVAVAEERFAVIFPWAGHDFRSWPLDWYAHIAQWLKDEKGIIPVFAGSTSDNKGLDQITDAFTSLTGTRPVRAEFAPSELDRFTALLSRAAFYLGNDTGPMHIAAAIGVPTIGLFGGGTWGRFYPYGDKCVVVHQHMTCYQCRWDCVGGHFNCVKFIHEDAVRTAIQRVLDDTLDWQHGVPIFIQNKDAGSRSLGCSMRSRLTRGMTELGALLKMTKRKIRKATDFSR